MGKVDRLISIVMILLQKNLVSATRLAQMLGVSKRTILRDMDVLSMSKVPIYSINGVNGGFGIMESYKIDKRLLTNSDIENILTALAGLEQILLSSEIATTLHKIQAMVNGSQHVSPTQWSFYQWDGRAEIISLYQICKEAMLQNRLLAFEYVDKAGIKSNRLVEPYQLHFSEMSCYLRAYCLERNELRTFKLARTENLHLTTQTFSPRAGLNNLSSEGSYELELTSVTVLISSSVKDHMIERYGRSSIRRHNADYYEANIQLPQNHIGYQFLASFGTELKVIEPASYLESFKIYLHEMFTQYV